MSKEEQEKLNGRVTDAVTQVENDRQAKIEEENRQKLIEKDIEIEEEDDSSGDGPQHVSTSLNHTDEEDLVEHGQPPGCLNLSEKKPATKSIRRTAHDLQFDSFSQPDAELPA